MAPCDVCHGPRCSLAGLGPCCWPAGSAVSTQCARPMGCWFFPVPRPPYVCMCVRCPRPLGSCSPVCPLGGLFCLCGVLGHLAPVHRCARWVCCFACAVSWATPLLFTGVPAWFVVLRVRCPGPLGTCSPSCLPGVLPVCAESRATWLLFTGVPAWCIVLHVRCPGPLGSYSPVCLLGALFCLCGVLGHLAPVHRCARLVRYFACAVSWATWLLFTGVPGGLLCCVCGVLGHLAPVHRCVLPLCCLCVRCRGPLGSCSPVCPLGALFCFFCVLGHFAPVHRCARLMHYFACAVSWATWLLFTGVPAWCIVLLLRFPGPVGSCSPVCPLGALALCAVSWDTWLLFTGVPAPRVALRVRCPGPLGSCSPVCPLGASPVCAVTWATWLLFTGVPTRCVVVRVRCPGPLGSCSPVRSPGVLCGVLGHLAPVHRCDRLVFPAVGCVCGA